jgi:hypothetical protein
MKKLSIIAAWLCVLVYFGIEAQAVAFGSFPLSEVAATISIENNSDLINIKAFRSLSAMFWGHGLLENVDGLSSNSQISNTIVDAFTLAVTNNLLLNQRIATIG